MSERSKDWLTQAEKDLEVAEVMINNGFFDWACFVAQQAAEKATKVVFQKLNAEVWGHSVLNLLKILGNKIKISDEILDYARILDKYYIPTRYPNAFECGSPFEYFIEEEAKNVVICAKKIIEFCKSVLA